MEGFELPNYTHKFDDLILVLIESINGNQTPLGVHFFLLVHGSTKSVCRVIIRLVLTRSILDGLTFKI